MSVVVPVYNGCATLERCIEAVLASGWDDRELIVVDDGSTDGSAELALRHPVFLLRFDRNRGAAAARNGGARLARGEILFFLDADVVVEPDTLGRVVASFAGAPGASALFCSFQPHTPAANFVSAYKNLRHHYTHQTAERDAATFCSATSRMSTSAPASTGRATGSCSYSLWRLARSDVVGRAIPWTRLMLRHGVFRADLNTRPGNVASVAAAWMLVASLAAGLFLPALLPRLSLPSR
jgi:glycosyltransferase involved in cell wall biosynthesis